LPEVLALSDEFIDRKVSSIEESKELKRLETQILPHISKPKISPRF